MINQVDMCRRLLQAELSACRVAFGRSTIERQNQIERLQGLGIALDAAAGHAIPSAYDVQCCAGRVERLEKAMQELDAMAKHDPARLENDPELVQKILCRAGVY